MLIAYILRQHYKVSVLLGYLPSTCRVGFTISVTSLSLCRVQLSCSSACGRRCLVPWNSFLRLCPPIARESVHWWSLGPVQPTVAGQFLSLARVYLLGFPTVNLTLCHIMSQWEDEVNITIRILTSHMPDRVYHLSIAFLFWDGGTTEENKYCEMPHLEKQLPKAAPPPHWSLIIVMLAQLMVTGAGQLLSIARVYGVGSPMLNPTLWHILSQ